MSQSTEEYLDSLLRKSLGIPDPEPEPISEEQIEESVEVEEKPKRKKAPLFDDTPAEVLNGTNFKSEKVSSFFADDTPFSDDFVYPEEALEPDESIEIPEDMQLTDEGRMLLDENFGKEDEALDSEEFTDDIGILDEPVDSMEHSDDIGILDDAMDSLGEDETVNVDEDSETDLIDGLENNDIELESILDEEPVSENDSDILADLVDSDMIEDDLANENATEAGSTETESMEDISEDIEEDVSNDVEENVEADLQDVEDSVPATMSIDDLDPNDSNKALSPEMIAALFAGANESAPAEEEAFSEDVNSDISDSSSEEEQIADIDSLEDDTDSEAVISDDITANDSENDKMVADEEISDLLNSLGALDESQEEAQATDMEVGGLDLGDVDLSAMLDDVTEQVSGDSESSDDTASDFSVNDLNDILNSIGDDEDLSDIGDLLNKDENSEIVDNESAMAESLFASDSEETLFGFDDVLGQEEEEDSKKKKKKEKKAKKKRKGLFGKKKVDDFEEIDGILGEDGEMTLDVDALEMVDEHKEKTGFWAKLFALLFDEVGEDSDALSDKLIEETAVDIAMEGAAVNEEIMKEPDESGKKKKKKDKKDKKSKKDKKASTSEDGESEEGEEEESSKKKKKKEKKVKKTEPEEPTKKLPKKKVIVISVFCASLTAIIIFIAYFVPYSYDMSRAKKFYLVGEYEKTYEYLRGHDLSGEEKDLYDRAFCLLKIQRQYDSYLNYRKLGYKTEALNALMQGVDAIDSYGPIAESLGISDKFYTIGNMIVDELFNEYGITMDEARELLNSEGTHEYMRRLYEKLYDKEPRDEEGNKIYFPEESDNAVLSAEENNL